MTYNTNHLRSALLAVLTGAVLTACSGNDLLEPVPGGGNFIISVEAEDATQTRTCIDPAGYRDGGTGLMW